MSIEKFDAIYQRAAERKDGEDQLEALLSHPLRKEELAAIPNDRWLAAFSMKVFQSGISWSVVRKKWPNFEEVFFDFKIEPLLMLSDEQWETKATDERIIRHLTKVMSIPANARMIHEASIQHGSFGKRRAVVASPKSVKSLHLVPVIIDSNDKLISTLALITVCFFWPYL